MKRITRFVAVMLSVLMLISALACKKNTGYEIPEGLTREEAALFTAIAAVCPKDDNHSKVEYLTFHIECWSFDEIPDAIESYIAEYASDGNAAVMPYSFDELIEKGYIEKGDGDFYGKDENTYKMGKGKIFTFTKVGDTDTDSVIVKLSAFISDNDTSGYDINLVWKDGKWVVESYANTWGVAYMKTQEPGTTEKTEPVK